MMVPQYPSAYTLYALPRRGVDGERVDGGVDDGRALLAVEHWVEGGKGGRDRGSGRAVEHCVD